MKLIGLLLLSATGGPVHYALIDQLTPSYKLAHCTGSGAAEMCDLYPAYAQADTDCGLNPPRAHDAVGCVIELPQGEYRWSQMPTMCRSHDVRGQGGDADSSRTVLIPDPNVGCFRLASIGECETDGDSTDGVAGSGGALLEGFSCNMTVTTTIATTPNVAPVIGVENRSGAQLRHMTIRGGVWGLWIDASVLSSTVSNANVWRAVDVHVWNSDHAAVVIRGPDTNAFWAESIDIIDSCRDRGTWDSQLGDCGAVRDRSFLGGTWAVPHVALTGGSPRAPAFLIDGDSNQRTTMLNPYVELDTGRSRLSPNSQVFGMIFGTTPFESNGGLTIFGRRASGMLFRNENNPNNVVELRVGDLASADSAWDATALSVQSLPALRLKSRLVTGGRFGFNVLNTTRDAVQIQMFPDPALGLELGALILPQGTGAARTGPQGTVPWCPWNFGGSCNDEPPQPLPPFSP